MKRCWRGWVEKDVGRLRRRPELIILRRIVDKVEAAMYRYENKPAEIGRKRRMACGTAVDGRARVVAQIGVS